MNWLHYLLEANIYLAVFYAGYCLFLNKETYYGLNRAYLLITTVAAFVLPVIQVGALKPADKVIQQTYTTIVQAPNPAVAAINVTYQPAVSHFTLQDAIWYLYIIGVAIMTLMVVIKIAKLISMIKASDKTLAGSYRLIRIEGSNTAFSFFNYLFIGTKTAGSDTIIRHEMVHIRQKHSADILFIELLRIVNWFNPIIYLLQISLKTLHEYIADEQTAAQGTDALAYSSFLVDNAYGLNGPAITHSFFNHNLLKKRIIMLNQQRSGNLARLKYLVAVPICAGMLCASTLAFSKTYALVDLAPKHQLLAQKQLKIATLDSVSKAQKRQQPSGIQKFPPPMIIKNGYSDLFNHLNQHISYPQNELKANIQGLVTVGFNVNPKGKISDIDIIKNSQREAFDQQALQAFKSYSGTLNETVGKHKVIIYFCTDYYGFIETPEAAELKAPGYDLNLMILGMHKYPTTKPKADKKAAVVQTPVQINDATKLPPPPPPAPPVKDAAIEKSSSPDLSEFYKYVGKHVRYPAIDRNNRIGGRVIASVEVIDGKFTNPQISRGVETIMDGEVLRVIKAYDGTLDLKNGTYVIPISFQLVDDKNNQVGHLPDAKAYDKQKTATDKTAKTSNSFSTAVALDEVVIMGYISKQ